MYLLFYVGFGERTRILPLTIKTSLNDDGGENPAIIVYGIALKSQTIRFLGDFGEK